MSSKLYILIRISSNCDMKCSKYYSITATNATENAKSPHRSTLIMIAANGIP